MPALDAGFAMLPRSYNIFGIFRFKTKTEVDLFLTRRLAMEQQQEWLLLPRHRHMMCMWMEDVEAVVIAYWLD
uniref:Uncharacterized protein n=1 Tax=Ditylenchus dipsaci TaxID=166011 RepID=A0A915EM93_9BILA